MLLVSSRSFKQAKQIKKTLKSSFYHQQWRVENNSELEKINGDLMTKNEDDDRFSTWTECIRYESLNEKAKTEDIESLATAPRRAVKSRSSFSLHFLPIFHKNKASCYKENKKIKNKQRANNIKFIAVPNSRNP
ncbi:Uncharacterized protein Fot_26256 [Forsythia ovata]|uniref:Translocon at the inner envelope membrane of chloroplasts 214 n=1 Tax=Forsythia ovata TaxID=205694 RepID=A0ABD1UCT0_9LAMI